MQTAVFKPVIFLKKRWLVLFFLIILITNILLPYNFYSKRVSAAETEVKIRNDSNAVVDESVFSKYYSSRRMVPIYKVARNDKRISITIDGAWGSSKTEDILDLLSEHDIKTSFFFAGRWLENNESLAGKILTAGHQIYNHSYNHPHFNSLSKKEMQIELNQTEALITKLRKKYSDNQTFLSDNSNLKKESDLLKIYQDFIKGNIDSDIPIKLNMLISAEELTQINNIEDISSLFKISNSYQANELCKINDLNHYNLNVDLFKNPAAEEITPVLGNQKFKDKEPANNNKDIKLFRPPYGEYNDLVIQTAREMNYHVIQWSLDSHDWMDPGKDYVIARIKNNVESGDILLFHNNSPEIIEILNNLIPYLKNNFKIVQIENLIYQDNYMIRSFDGLQYLLRDDRDEN